MHARFHAPAATMPGQLVALPAEEAEHLARVLRLKPGAAVRVFDGRGLEYSGVLESVTKSTAMVRLRDRVDPAPEPRVAITLAQAVLKGEKMDHVVRDAVMMGAAAIVPMLTHRTEVALSTLDRANRRERWERIAVSSAKQCGRAVVPKIHEPRAFDDVLRALDADMPLPALMPVEPGAGSPVSVGSLALAPPNAASLLIGPEGGWTPEEIDRSASLCQHVSIGGRTLRGDAMAVIAMTAAYVLWKEY
jgi:16S rRNA (uracil1498-N3)-methyltransferase